MTQIHYRLEQYEEAYDGCLQVIDKARDQYEEERQTNLAAINAYIMSSGLVILSSSLFSDVSQMWS